MSAKVKRIPTYVKMIAAILTPVIITVIAFYIYGMHIRDEDKIYPNILIAGTDVSGLTREEAMLSLELPVYEERSRSVELTLVFPDDSKLVITGSDAGLWHNAREVVADAHAIGRGRGVMQDVFSYLQRINASNIYFGIEFELDEAKLKKIVTDFTDDYNRRLEASEPVIYDDRIVFTKGAGHVSADFTELYDLAYTGLIMSLNEGIPIAKEYALPETIKIASELFEVRDRVFIPVVSSEFDPETNSATISVVGVDFDAIAAARLLTETESGRTATFYLEFTHPEYSQEYLDSLLFRDLFGERTTWVHGSANRLGNVDLSASAINGLVLLPGDEFSFNGVVGQRTYDRGYRAAPALVSGETVMDIGGGICQTSSTLYAAIRPTELLVTEQQRHGKPVPYLPWGWDATVYWPYLDLKFVNNTDYPMRIEMELDERNLTARVFGTIIDDFPIAAG